MEKEQNSNQEYKIVNLSHMILELGEEKCKDILSKFYCPKNKDVQEFINVKAIEFAKQGLAATHLVLSEINNKMEILGYFTLSNKTLSIKKRALSKTLIKRISKFATYDNETHKYMLGAILIGQLGKNYDNNLNQYISGQDLLALACNKVKEAQLDIGGKVVYLECEDKDILKNFYQKNGFINFGRRNLDRDETEKLSGKYLIQYLRYL